jgi:hypothetical protein
MKKYILSILAFLLFSIGAYAQCFTPVWTEPSIDSMLIYVSMASLNGTNLQIGDEVGVFDGEDCVGVEVLTEELTGAPIYLVIEASRDRPRHDGFRPGRTIIYQFCSGGEVTNPAVTPTYLSNGPAFAANDSCVVELRAVNTDPTITSIPDTVAFEDALYSSAITAVDIDGDSLIYSAPLFPTWLSFNDTTHVLSGTPVNDDVGDHTVTLRVYDGRVNVDTSFIIHVENINDAPIFTSIPDTMALEDTPYSSGAIALDIDGDSLIYSARRLPSWLSFNDITHVLSGTPVNDDVGNHPVTLRVYDGTVNVDTSFVIHVENLNYAPTFTAIPDTIALEDLPYTYTVTAEDEEGDTLSYRAPVLPIWLSFDTVTHILSGTPENDHVGENSVALTINDGTSDAVQSFVITVENVNDPPIVTSLPVTEARPGTAYSYTVTAEDVDGDDVTYTALVLPGWLTFNPTTHMLSATPGETDIGDQHVNIRISDGSLYVDHTFIITVSLGNHAPTFTSDPVTSVVVGELYVYTISAQDIDNDALSYSAPLLPDWLTFYPATHEISGVPYSGDLGPHDVTVRVSDGTVSADQSFPITVQNINIPPTFTSAPLTSVTEGELYVYYATAEDADGENLVFNAPVLPYWLSFDVTTQVLHGTPGNGDEGEHNVSLMVSDGEGVEIQSFIITVEVQSGVGIDDFRSPDFMVVYPNPSDGRVIVELSRELEREIILEILDPMGKVLLQQEFPPYFLIKEEYNMSDRPAGIYLIRVYNDSHQSIRKLMIH